MVALFWLSRIFRDRGRYVGYATQRNRAPMLQQESASRNMRESHYFASELQLGRRHPPKIVVLARTRNLLIPRAVYLGRHVVCRRLYQHCQGCRARSQPPRLLDQVRATLRRLHYLLRTAEAYVA